MLTVTKRFINPVIRRFAGQTRPFALIRHVGRRSGKTYETPLIVLPLDGGFLLTLTYGPEVDWYRNLQAAGRAELIWRGQQYIVGGLEALDVQTALRAFPIPLRWILQLRGTRDFVKVKRDIPLPTS